MVRLLPLFLLCAGLSLRAADSLDALLTRSPFFPRGYVPGKSAKDDRAKGRLEFGGFLETASGVEISLLNTATGESAWVKLRDASAPYFVENFDPAGPAVTVKADGLSLRLLLRALPAETGPVAPAAPAAPAQAVILDPAAASRPPVVAPAAPAETTSPEPNRIPRQGLRVPPRADDPK